ncbi:MAG TPA: extracellular solute-binding protein, partial [Pirellulales bacterium]|nr:extracellular solute-binding protein [Pirellulales bacterium]
MFDRSLASSRLIGVSFGVAMLIAALAAGCSSRSGSSSGPPPQSSGNSSVAEQPAPANSLELLFTYGSEKQKWIEEATAAFNSAGHKLADGRVVFVRAYPMGSGECIDELLSGRRQAHLTSPASAAYLTLGNAQSRAKTGKALVGSTQNLVLSPVVIAMWRPMAEALGWGKKSVGWADILELARDPKGWANRGHPEWGTFKFGHTHPDYSNSGLISLFAEVYAAAGKVNDLSLADVSDSKVAKYLHDIEAAVVHYGSSTGFFGAKMFSGGPQYLSAAVLYENMVIDSYGSAGTSQFPPVVAIYPKEGTFWSDHPVGLVEREWVTPAHREAADAYIKFLLERPQQERAMAFGFRPSEPQVSLAAPLDSAHGIDSKEPKTTLPVPSVEVMDAVKKLWHENKKHANLVLVLDISGSMQFENKLTNAKIGATELIKLLDDPDE